MCSCFTLHVDIGLASCLWLRLFMLSWLRTIQHLRSLGMFNHFVRGCNLTSRLTVTDSSRIRLVVDRLFVDLCLLNRLIKALLKGACLLTKNSSVLDVGRILRRGKLAMNIR